MNEVIKINLGRQVFTLEINARQDLMTYINAIKKEIGQNDLMDEIENRMAELLLEKGLSSEKVVLKKDIEYLKEQLGSPKDFKDDETVTENQTETASKKLYRDTDNALIAGVASGLGAYFGIDPLLFRIAFVVLLFITFGGGILLYILLWILIPEAKTSSEKLQMTGKPVNIQQLKQLTENNDVTGAAKRFGNHIGPIINNFLSFILKLVGTLISIFGLILIFAMIGFLIYYLSKQSIWLNYNLFPLGNVEHVLLFTLMAGLSLIGVLIVIIGLALFKNKWPIKAWVTGSLIGLIAISLAGSLALSASAYPAIRDRYNSRLHSTNITLSPFNSVSISGQNFWNINFDYSSSYYVSLNYFGNPSLKNIKTSVKNGELFLDTSMFDNQRNCPVICLPNFYNLTIDIHSPNSSILENQFQNTGFVVPSIPTVMGRPVKSF